MESPYEFYCYDCESEFNEPEVVDEPRGEFWGTPCYERICYCPYCGSGYIEETRYVDLEEDEEEM